MIGKQYNIIIQIIRTLLIILWVYASVSKVIDYSVFTDQLQRQPLPEWSVNIFVWALPLTELTAAALLCFRDTLRSGLLLSCVLLLAFTVYVGMGLLHVYAHVPCSCGGILGRMGWGRHLVFNAIFTALSFFAFFSIERNKRARLYCKNYELCIRIEDDI